MHILINIRISFFFSYTRFISIHIEEKKEKKRVTKNIFLCACLQTPTRKIQSFCVVIVCYLLILIVIVMTLEFLKALNIFALLHELNKNNNNFCYIYKYIYSKIEHKRS